jgi:hypothetical protein
MSPILALFYSEFGPLLRRLDEESVQVCGKEEEDRLEDVLGRFWVSYGTPPHHRLVFICFFFTHSASSEHFAHLLC